MHDHDLAADFRDYTKETFTADELGKLFTLAPYEEFISRRTSGFKERGWDKKLPTKKQFIAGVLEDPNLLRRPILVKGRKVLIGFKAEAYGELVK